MRYILYIFLSYFSFIPNSSFLEHDNFMLSNERLDRKYVLSKINDLRTNGCRCGDEYYPPASPLVWDDTLEKSAYTYARSMYENDYFSHYSPDGKDIGDRLDILGYNWQYAGENLGEGQKNFEEVMHDWIASPTHCKMLMNPHMEEVGVARYRLYWVQHFGKKMPVDAKRINRRFTEGAH